MTALPTPVASLMLMLSMPALADAAAGEPAQRAERQQSAQSGPPPGMVRTELRIQRVIVRVPRMAVASSALTTARTLPPIDWVERKADRCVPIARLTAAAVTRPDSIDLVLNDGKRMRARLDDACPALDFYSGFYLKATADGMMCESRDVIRSRSGGQCRIRAFRTLVPAR